MTTNDPNDTSKPDWSLLAKEALDIWQGHLTSLAADTKAKEEMTRLVEPMGRMFADWTEMVQESVRGMMVYSAAAQKAGTYASESAKTEPAAPAEECVVQEPVTTEPLTTESATMDPVEKSSSFDRPVEVERQAQTVQAMDVPVAPQASEFQTDESQAEDKPYEPESLSVSDERNAVEPVAVSASAVETTRRGVLPADGARNLAELAGRLAVLERELEQLRAKKRGDEAESESFEALQRVAGSHQGPSSV